MRVVALEEHVTIPSFNAEPETTVAQRGGARRAELEDIDGARLASMNEAGITIQVLSVPGPGAVLFSPEAGPSYARAPIALRRSRICRRPFPKPRPTNSNARSANAARAVRSSAARPTESSWTIPTSGFFTLPPFLAALLTFGADRILFSVDYPFSNNAIARAFLDALPVSPDDREKIAHGNADRLLKLS